MQQNLQQQQKNLNKNQLYKEQHIENESKYRHTILIDSDAEDVLIFFLQIQRSVCVLENTFI